MIPVKTLPIDVPVYEVATITIPTWDVLIQVQGVPDECDQCKREFVWLVSAGSSPVCPFCLTCQYRTLKDIERLRAKWRDIL
jgi:hypothetical protein